MLVEGSPATVSGDPEHLGHVLLNLIDNAIKFSSAGTRVTVRSWWTPTEAGVTVEDEGPGISDELPQRVSERFFRAESVTNPHDPAAVALASPSRANSSSPMAASSSPPAVREAVRLPSA